MTRRGIFALTAWLVAALAFAPGAVAQDANERLAIGGYDPVAYFTESKPMMGDPRFEDEWDGVVYRFASARHLDMFKADPDQYLPQYANWCTASMARGELTYGEPENWIVLDGQLYLFGKPIGPGLMREDPVAMKNNADQHWANLSQHGPAVTPQ